MKWVVKRWQQTVADGWRIRKWANGERGRKGRQTDRVVTV